MHCTTGSIWRKSVNVMHFHLSPPDCRLSLDVYRNRELGAHGDNDWTESSAEMVGNCFKKTSPCAWILLGYGSNETFGEWHTAGYESVSNKENLLYCYQQRLIILLRCASMISLLRQSSKRFHWWVPSLCTTVWMNQGRCRWRLNHANSESLFKLFAENPTSTEASSHFLVYCILL